MRTSFTREQTYQGQMPNKARNLGLTAAGLDEFFEALWLDCVNHPFDLVLICEAGRGCLRLSMDAQPQAPCLLKTRTGWVVGDHCLMA
jgi:hypothetical protein